VFNCHQTVVICLLTYPVVLYVLLYTLMFDVQHGTAQVYLIELCERCSDTRLCSSSRGDFNLPRTNLRLSDKAFCVLFTDWRPLVCH